MKEPQEPATESESQGNRCLCLELQGSIIELKLFKCISQVRILRSVRRVKPAVHHGIDLLISRQRLCARNLGVGDRVAYPRLFYVFQACRNITYHSGIQFLARDKLSSSECADLHDLRLCTSRHHEDRGSFPHSSLLDPAEHNNPFVRVIFRIKDERLEGRIRITLRSRNLFHDLLQHFMDILPSLR